MMMSLTPSFSRYPTLPNLSVREDITSPYVTVPSASAASASAPPSSLHHGVPLETLRSLTMLPHGLSSAMARGRSGRVRKGTKGNGKSHPLAKDGQLISRIYGNNVSRPYPRLGLNLFQETIVEFSNLNPTAFIISSATPTVSTFASRTFAVSDFPGSSALLTAFDQYKILQIEAWIDPIVPESTASLPEMTVAVDLDDANTPSSVGQVLDKLGATTASGGASHYHRWRPHTAVAVYSGAFTSFANVPSQWIDSASSNVQHYGLKAASVSFGSTVLPYSITFRGVVAFRAPVIN